MLRKMLPQYSKTLLKRKKLVFVIAVLIVTCVAILNTTMSPDLYFLTLETFENVSCHYIDDGDALPRIEQNADLPVKSIFFHETSCRGTLNSRQACAVESAARTHPQWQVNVMFSGPVPETNLKIGSLGALKQFDNVKFFRLHLVEYAKGTPLEELISDGALNRTRWRIAHTSDALRYLSLYKWGGVYLDLDVVVAKSFETLVNNWSALETYLSVAAGALSFSRDDLGRIVAEAAIKNFKNNYRGDLWGHNGPGVITRILEDMCDTRNLTQMSTETCYGFGVYPEEMFYPVSWMDAMDYFKPGALRVKDPYAYHLWNKLTHDFVVRNDSAYANLARKYCPTTHKLYGDFFGI